MMPRVESEEYLVSRMSRAEGVLGDFGGGKQSKELWLRHDKVGSNNIIGPYIFY